MKLGLICILSAFALVPFVSAQTIDTTFCDVSNIVSDDGQKLPLPYRNESEIYWASIEHNQQVTNAYGIEITELYDGRDNVGVAIQRVLGGEILTYTFENEDEVLFISDAGCRVLRQEEALTLSPFQVITINGKKHLASPLTLISSKPNIPNAYLGSNNRFVRGMPVREWRACVYSETQQSTVRITISYTNKDKWVTAFSQVPGQESVPVQIRMDHKPASLTMPQYTEIYSIMEFKTNDLVNRAAYAVPNGVYCPGRFTKRNWPKLPETFSFVAHFTAADDLASKNGIVLPLRFEYDTKKQLARADSYNPNKQLETVIEDFATGLTYELNRYLGTCKITLNDVTQPKDIFRLDEEPRPEYLGRHYVRGISTEAWIAPRNFSGDTIMMEWHFMSNGWTTVEAGGAIAGEPIASYFYFKKNIGISSETKIVRDEYQIANFDRTRVDYYDFDVASCEQLPRRHLRFTVTDKERFEVMKGNPKTFREAAYFAVEESAKVRIIRLSRFGVIFEDNTAFIEFTLLEKSQLGFPTVESSNSEAYNKLMTDINDGNLIIKFKTTQNAEITVRADKGSFRDVDVRNGRYMYNYVKGQTIGTSTGVVVVLVLLFIVVGLAIGLVGGVFIIIKRVVNIPLPGPLSFFNPNFNEAESA